jgi:molybdopterin synthase catalytic subunit
MTLPREPVRIVVGPINTAAETEAVAAASGVGAVVTFSGICRADEKGEAIAALHLEHYPGMAEQEIGKHVEEAQQRWPLLGVRVIHRVGRIEPGEVIVFVVTASAHREAAFAAAEYIMDFLKTRAPFWKKTEGAKGSESWVDANAKDDKAAARWKKNAAE